MNMNTIDARTMIDSSRNSAQVPRLRRGLPDHGGDG
jgi:hypothetical protein